MDAERLFKAIARHLGKDMAENENTPLPERVAQYNSIFTEDKLREVKDAIGGLSGGNLFNAMIDQRWKKIVDSNPCLGLISSRARIEGVETPSFATKTVAAPNGEVLILLDSSTMVFLWQMNKAFLYGPSQLSEPDNTKLYTEIFLHFATCRRAASIGAIYPRPKTPPHNNTAAMNALGLFIELQETFLLCHEMAHTYIESGLSLPNELLSSTERNLAYQEFYPANKRIDDELLADDLAFEWTLNTTNRLVPEAVEIASTALFLMIRYFMWLNVVVQTEEGDTESHLWFARNGFMRRKIRQVYSWGKPSFIVDLFEHLESTLEPASLIAAACLKDISSKGNRHLGSEA